MPTISVKIKNLDQIKRAFRKAPALMTKYLNEAIKKSVLDIGGEASKNSPVDTGRMRASILSDGLVLSNLRGQVGPTPFYSIFVEMGTKFMQARPFLHNAVRSREEAVQRYFVQAVQKTLDDIGRNV